MRKKNNHKQRVKNVIIKHGNNETTAQYLVDTYYKIFTLQNKHKRPRDLALEIIGCVMHIQSIMAKWIDGAYNFKRV